MEVEEYQYPEDKTECLLPHDLSVQSEITKFYEGRNILVTGASGFIGVLLVERLLRSCHDLSKLTIIVRAKKGVSPADRCTKMFQNAVFSRLKKEKPNFMEKVRILSGDAGELNFGLSEEDQQLIMDTNLIFHMAASVRFEEKVRVSVNINVRGTKELLRMARQMPNLQAFVYVSTAFSHCVYKAIDEKHYKPPIESDKLIELINLLPDEKLEQMVPVLLGKWPNMYTLTKAVAEHAVLQDSVGLPACIVRPSIVMSTSREPLTGWTNNMYGATGIIAAIGVGLVRVLHILENGKAEVVPADYVVANIIAAAWDTGRNGVALKAPDGNANVPDIERVPVYNYVSTTRNPVTWNAVLEYNGRYGVQTPSDMVIWYYMVIFTKYRLAYEILVFFLHTIPAILVDTAAYLTGRKVILRKAYQKIHKFTNILSYFTTNEWRFVDDRVVKLWDKMGMADRRLFPFDIKELDWDDYFSYHIRGLRLYLLNDPMDTVEAAKKKYRKLKIAHYTLCTGFGLLVLWLVTAFIRFLWSFCPYSNY